MPFRSNHLLLLVATVRLVAAEQQSGGNQAVEFTLPPMLIEGSTYDESWQYARAGEVEVLTQCGAGITNKVIRAKIRSRHFLPVDLQVVGNRPLRFIFFNQPVATLVPEPSVSVLSTDNRWGEATTERTNLRSRQDGITAGNLWQVSSWPLLNTPYALYYLENSRPLPPRWLVEGLLGDNGALSGLAAYTTHGLTRLSAFAWDQVKEVKAMLEQDDTGHGIYPLAELFESPSPVEPVLLRRWSLQAALFCRWQIYSPEGQRKGGHAFWNWARLARAGPVNEATFRACFGFGYAQAQARMRKYLGRFLGVYVDVPIRLYPLADELELQPATDAEIGRMLGAFLWQEAKRLKDEGDAYTAGKYEAAARRTYDRGLKRTGGDPDLNAGLGILEYESGGTAKARSHLEAAWVGKCADVQALLMLARLRFEEAKTVVDKGSRLDAGQLSRVLNPLFEARLGIPVAVEVYQLIAETWALSAVPPETRHLNVLLEGVANYPHDLELAYRVAELHVANGHSEIARTVAQRGLKLAGKSEYLARFEALLAGLGPP